MDRARVPEAGAQCIRPTPHLRGAREATKPAVKQPDCLAGCSSLRHDGTDTGPTQSPNREGTTRAENDDSGTPASACTDEGRGQVRWHGTIHGRGHTLDQSKAESLVNIMPGETSWDEQNAHCPGRFLLDSSCRIGSGVVVAHKRRLHLRGMCFLILSRP